MSDIIFAMIVGPLMWVPVLNMFVGLLAFGMTGFGAGLIMTILAAMCSN